MFTKALLIGGALAIAGAANAGVLYSQSWDQSGNLYGSQNDVGNFGNFAATYDDFTLSTAANLTEVDVVGGFFNPPTAGAISQFTLTLYADNGGVPGSAIASGIFGGTGTYLGSQGGFPTYSYAFTFLPYGVGAGTYWVSAVPDLGFPPQWGSATSGQGNGNAYQCFFGACNTLSGTNLAFTVYGDATGGVPEPATWSLMLMGFGGLGAAMRSRRKAVAA